MRFLSILITFSGPCQRTYVCMSVYRRPVWTSVAVALTRKGLCDMVGPDFRRRSTIINGTGRKSVHSAAKPIKLHPRFQVEVKGEGPLCCTSIPATIFANICSSSPHTYVCRLHSKVLRLHASKKGVTSFSRLFLLFHIALPHSPARLAIFLAKRYKYTMRFA